MKPSLNAMAKEAKTKKVVRPKKAAMKAPPLTTLSTEFVQDSDSEGDENSDQASSDGEDSLPDNPTMAVSKTTGNVATEDSSSSSGSSSESESEEVNEEDTETSQPSQKSGRTSSSSSAHPRPSNAPTTKTVSFRDAIPYKPPTGFETASLDQPSNASKLFKESDLEGKQIWYITAPASVPISSIGETSLASIKQGNVVLLHNENEYGFSQDSSEDITYTKVLVPNSAEDGYLAGAKSVDRILHLQQIVQLPSFHDAHPKEPESSTTARPTYSTKKPIRQQPSGLKMRFRPLGFGKGSTGTIGPRSSSTGASAESGSDQEMEDAPPQFRRPASLEPSPDAGVDAPAKPSKSIVKSKIDMLATKKSSKVGNHKRKHSEKEGFETRNKKEKKLSGRQPISVN